MLKYVKVLCVLICSAAVLVASVVGAFGDAPATALLLDDYNREALGVEGEGGGEYGMPNNRGITIYWMQYNANTKPSIVDDALKLEFGGDGEGWFGQGGSIKSEDGYKYLVMRVKGEAGGEETLVGINPDARHPQAVAFADLVDPDGNPLTITTEWQDLIIDMEKSELNSRLYEKGFEALHFNSFGACTIYIDEIYLMQTYDLANEPVWTGMGASAGAINPDELDVPEGTTTAAPYTLAAPYTGSLAELGETGAADDSGVSGVVLALIIAGGAVLISVLLVLLVPAKKK